ncbi:MAG: LysR family transcriptional regulator [Proteobacteria bacterium]|nr:MAG: LysR family transcriptional regulator [Pseudomonadota bacterium]
MMEIKRIHHFRTVVEAGGLSKAAALLHLTPGALSKSIRQLEDETGQTLFHRVSRKLLLTDSGTHFYHASEALMLEYDRVLKALAHGTPKTAAALRIASFEVFTTHVLAAVVAAMRVTVPLRVLELPVRRIGQAVANREADLGITYAPYPQRGLEFTPIGVAKFSIFARRGAFENTAFPDLPFALPTTAIDGSTAGLLGIDGWPYEQISRLVRFELTSLESALALARRGLCAVFIPRFVAAIYNRGLPRAAHLVARSSPPRMRRVEHPIYTVTRSEQSNDDHLNEFIERLVTIIALPPKLD